MSQIIDKIQDNIKDWLNNNKDEISNKVEPIKHASTKIRKYIQRHKDAGHLDDFSLYPLYTMNKIDCIMIINNTHYYCLFEIFNEEVEDTLHPDIYKAYDRAMRGI